MSATNEQLLSQLEDWPRAELVGGPMDGVKILAPEAKYRAPLAIPDTFKNPEDYADYKDEEERMEISLHWYVPMTVMNVLRKSSVFYYAYAGETSANDPLPDTGTLYDRSTLVHPAFAEELENNDD